MKIISLVILGKSYGTANCEADWEWGEKRASLIVEKDKEEIESQMEI